MDDLDKLDIPQLLRTIPPFQPRIIALTWVITGDNGEVDPKKAALHSLELTQAIHEVEQYSTETKELIQCLKNSVRPNF